MNQWLFGIFEAGEERYAIIPRPRFAGQGLQLCRFFEAMSD